MTQGMQSGDDSPLKNVWDDVCVQVQYEETMMWDVYLDTIRSFIEFEEKGYDIEIKQAIWLQTEERIDWAFDNEQDEEKDIAEYCEDDIIEYIINLKNQLLLYKR